MNIFIKSIKDTTMLYKKSAVHCTQYTADYPIINYK